MRQSIVASITFTYSSAVGILSLQEQAPACNAFVYVIVHNLVMLAGERFGDMTRSILQHG